MIGIHRYSNFPNRNILKLVDMFIQVVDFNTKSKWDKNRIRIIGLLTPDEILTYIIPYYIHEQIPMNVYTI